MTKAARVRGWYNGYNWEERYAKLKVLKQRLVDGEMAPATGPCQLCGDPDVPVEYHDEDYSKEYFWGPPALFVLCRNCHRDKLHKRFARPFSWAAFLAHVRRGGYARDLQDKRIKGEIDALARALATGANHGPLQRLRSYSAVEGEEWFATLSVDPVTISPEAPRPRP